MVGLGNVNNTADSAKPVSTAQQTALNLKANIASPTFTGVVTTAGQVAFPAAQNPSADVNTLDDYEEGTFTPTVTSSGGTITSVSGNTGIYQKVGRWVHFKVQATITDAGTGSGFVLFSLPFTPDNTFSAWGREFSLTGKQLQGQINSTVASVRVVFYDNTYPGAVNNLLVVQGSFTTAN